MPWLPYSWNGENYLYPIGLLWKTGRISHAKYSARIWHIVTAQVAVVVIIILFIYNEGDRLDDGSSPQALKFCASMKSSFPNDVR